MGIQKGNLTCTRFRIDGTHPVPSLEFIDRQIRKFVFKDFFPVNEERIMGWTSMDNVLDTKFEKTTYMLGDYLVMSFRTDRRIVPPALMKIRLLAEEQKLVEKNKGRKLTKNQRESLREAVRGELMENASPIPTIHEICWSMSTGNIIFTSLVDKQIQEFQAFFRDCFELNLLPYTPWTDKGIQKNHVINPEKEPVGVTPIGREFLTWLWFKSAERSGTILVPEIGDVGLNFLRRLVLVAGEGEYAESVICQGHHSDLKEGMEALRQGKKVREARIRLAHDSEEWEFTLKADAFQFQSIKLPVKYDPEEEDQDNGGKLLERIYLIETIFQTMDRLFTHFLEMRNSRSWEKETVRMANWVSPAGQ
jgi:recombination associated protein RdgC